MARHGRRRRLWIRDSRSRAAERAEREQLEEYQAAVRRILREPTQLLPVPPSAPLLTRGQAFRSGGRP